MREKKSCFCFASEYGTITPIQAGAVRLPVLSVMQELLKP